MISLIFTQKASIVMEILSMIFPKSRLIYLAMDIKMPHHQVLLASSSQQFVVSIKFVNGPLWNLARNKFAGSSWTTQIHHSGDALSLIIYHTYSSDFKLFSELF